MCNFIALGTLCIKLGRGGGIIENGFVYYSGEREGVIDYECTSNSFNTKILEITCNP